MLNTVGKPGRLGEGVRCVVSVSMLSEGWDANTVTHVLGVRAFGSQLLCEQVVGRGLRRRSYVANAEGFFEPEYAEVYGVPFNVIPTDRPVVDPPVKPPPVRVRALVERRGARITFPRLDGYRIEVPDHRLYADLTDAPPYVVRTNAIPTTTETAGLIGTSEVQDLGRFRAAREASVAFTLAKQLMPSFAQGAGERRWLFPQLVGIAQRWLAERVVYESGTFPGMLLVGSTLADAANRLRDAIVQQSDGREPRVLPVFAGDTLTGSTDVVSFSTTKRVIETSGKCHVDGVVLDGRDGNTWEQIAAMACEACDDVAAYAKNDHLELAIPYTVAGRAHRYLPDFVVRLTPGEDGVARHLLLEVSGGVGRAAKDVKTTAARTMWCAAVNNDGRFGRWGFVEVDDPVRTAPALRAAIAALRVDAPVTGLPSVLEHVLAETTDDDEELFRATADAP